MKVPEPTRENCEKLAERVVEDMDMDALIEYAEEGITEWYFNQGDYETWKEDWKFNMEE